MVHDVYSKRAVRSSGRHPDVYQYDYIPDRVKNQIIVLWGRLGIIDRRDTIDALNSLNMFSAIAEILKEEYGTLQLAVRHYRDRDIDEVIRFFLSAGTAAECLDVIELVLRSSKTLFFAHDLKAHREMVDTVNFRFREGGIGFQYEADQIIRVDHQFIHAEVTKPALLFLQDSAFGGANAEFLRAHQHYKDGNYKECLVEASKTLESTIKIICGQRQWGTEGDTASKLMNTIFSKGLVPNYIQSQMGALKSTLEGVVTIRNKAAGHGQGAEMQEVPDYLASYALHQTASSVLFLIKAHKAL